MANFQIFQFKTLAKSLFRKGSFVQNVGSISIGKLVVIITSFVFIPILSRLYGPEAYGSFALFNSIVSIAVLIIGMGYPRAFVIIEKKVEFHNILAFLLFVTLIFTLISLVVVGILKILNIELFSTPAISWMIPIGILIGSLINLFSGWNVREGAFRLASFLEGSGNIFIRLINLLQGVAFGAPVFGIIVGDLIGKSYASLINLYRFFTLEFRTFIEDFSFSKIRESLITYNKYLLFIFPSQLINQFGTHLPIYLLSIFYGQSVLGYFSMANSLLGIPMQLLSNGLSTVYFKKATDLYKASLAELSRFTEKLLQNIFLLLLLPFVFTTIFSEEIFVFFLGKGWAMTGVFVSYMASYYYLSLVLSPIKSIFQVLRMEKWVLAFDVIQMVVLVLVLSISHMFFDSPEYLIISLSGILVMFNLVLGFSISRALKMSFIKNILRYFLLYIGLVVVLLYIKNIFIS